VSATGHLLDPRSAACATLLRLNCQLNQIKHRRPAFRSAGALSIDPIPAGNDGNDLTETSNIQRMQLAAVNEYAGSTCRTICLHRRSQLQTRGHKCRRRPAPYPESTAAVVIPVAVIGKSQMYLLLEVLQPLQGRACQRLPVEVDSSRRGARIALSCGC